MISTEKYCWLQGFGYDDYLTYCELNKVLYYDQKAYEQLCTKYEEEEKLNKAAIISVGGV